MSMTQRTMTLDDIQQIESFVAAKKRLLTEVKTVEVRELLEIQINDLQRRKKELIDALSNNVTNAVIEQKMS